MPNDIATTVTGTVASVYPKATDAERAVARLKAAGFGDVRLSERSGTTSAEHVDESEGRTATDFAASLEAAGFARADARSLTDAVAGGATLVTLAAGSRSDDALAVLRGETLAPRAISAVDVIAPAATSLTAAPVPTAAPGPSAAAAMPSAAAHVPSTAATVPSAATTDAGIADVDADPQTLELREERLDVQKVREQSEARIRKEVITEQRTITVPVQREELVVERDGERDVRIPLSDDDLR